MKRRKHRSDALGWQRAHLNEHPKHEVEIVERKADSEKSKSKAPKPAKKGKAKKAPKAEAQKEAAA